MSGGAAPPRLARSLLRRALPSDVRQEVVGDLDEVFRRRLTTGGAARARLWYWREAVSFAGTFLRERYLERRDRTPGVGAGGRARGRGGVFSWLDVKLGFRMLVKYPGLTLVGTLGIAVVVALAVAWFEFSSNMTRPRLPFDEGERIVRIQNWDVGAGEAEPRSLHDFATWQRELRSVEDLAAVSPGEFRLLVGRARSEPVRGARVTPSVFRLVRVAPVLGRTLVEADAEPGGLPAVVIGYDLWQRWFEADARVVGRAIRLRGEPHTVVGVMPEGFGFPVNQELWIVLRDDPQDHARGEGPPIIIWGRLAPGYSRGEAQAELTAIGARAAAEFPATNERLRPRVGAFIELDEAVMASAANLAFVLLLLVVCANIATLVFARTVTREGEIALRTALGASRSRIVLQLFTEGLVLTLFGSALGLAAAAWGLGRGMDLFWEVQQQRPPFWFDTSVSFSTALYVVTLAVLGGAVIGVIPGLKATGSRIRGRLALIGSQGSRMKFGAVSTGVIVVQVALCVALLPLALLAGRDLLPRHAEADGFTGSGMLSGRLTAEVDLGTMTPAARRAFLARAAELHEEVRRRVAAEPGVGAVTFAERLPGMNHPGEVVRIEGDAASADTAADTYVRALAVDAEFFRATQARVIAGRTFTPAEVESGAPVVVVGQSFARDILKGRNALGQRLRYPDRAGAEGDRWHEVIGVVADPPLVAFGAGEYVGMYRPLVPGQRASLQLFVATPDGRALIPRIHEIVMAVDPRMAIDELMSMEEVWRPVRRSDRFFMVALAVVGGIGLLLSLAGMYALMSFTVAQRMHEIAIRAALGARPRRIILAIFSRAFAQIGLGAAAGALLISLTVVDSSEGGRAVAAVTVLMLLVGMAACAPPALRALRIEPADALRRGG